MCWAIGCLSPQPEYVLFDYISFDQFRDCPADFIKKGDRRIQCHRRSLHSGQSDHDHNALPFGGAIPIEGFETHKG